VGLIVDWWVGQGVGKYASLPQGNYKCSVNICYMKIMVCTKKTYVVQYTEKGVGSEGRNEPRELDSNTRPRNSGTAQDWLGILLAT
jgi:hypothetical protein